MSQLVRRQFSLVLALSTPQRQLYKERRIHVTKGQSESGVHIMLKILAFANFFDRHPVIEPRLNYRYRPDVAIFSPDNATKEDNLCKNQRYTNDLGIEEWIECKRTAPKKIRRILRNLNCTFSLFHWKSALHGYQRVLLRILGPSELSKVRLFGTVGDLESCFEILRSERAVVVSKKPNLIIFSSKKGESIGQFPVEEVSWKTL